VQPSLAVLHWGIFDAHIITRCDPNALEPGALYKAADPRCVLGITIAKVKEAAA
jgi:hypothetical protein